MFDVSFFELLVVGAVALIVIGPEKLPGAIRSGALWIGRIRHAIAKTRTEIEQHIGADDIRRQLHNEQIMATMAKWQETRTAIEQDILSYQEKINQDLREAGLIDANGNPIESAEPPSEDTPSLPAPTPVSLIKSPQ